MSIRKLFKNLLIIIIVLFTVAGIAAFLFFNGIIRCNYPPKKEFPLSGIDISHHQGDIDWKKLKQENLSFVIIKATEGGDFVDQKFQQNAKNALKHGYYVGAYHFYRFCRDGKSQAHHFISTIKNFCFTLPPAVDIEFGGNCSEVLNRNETVAQIQEFLDTLELVYKTPPIIYATQEAYKELIKDRFIRNPIWIRDILKKPKLTDKREWKLWQFANRGKLMGINTFVDINVFNGDTLQFYNTTK